MKQSTVYWQRAEAFAFFVAATAVYFVIGGSLLIYALLILAFDISMLGYFINSKLGARFYNVAHSFVLPVLLLGFAYVNEMPGLAQFSLLWLAHIGMDRSQGYGLKEDKGFIYTHLGRIGRPSKK